MNALLRAEHSRSEHKSSAPHISVQDFHAFVTEFQVRPEEDSVRRAERHVVVVQMLSVGFWWRCVSD